MRLINKLLSSVHILLAKSKIATYLAAKIRNQCDLIIYQRFGASDMDPAKNGEYLLLEFISPYCNVYFDVGANKGEWTNFILENKKVDYKCYLFEPGLAAFACLREKFSNNVHIELKNAALSNAPGILEFYEEENAGEMSSAIKGWANNPCKTIHIACTTVDQEINFKNISFLDFLKIDVEGFDLKVIEGAAQSLNDQKIGLIQFEYNSGWMEAGSSLLNAYKILEAKNYKIYLINSKGLVPFDINIYGDFYSFSNFLAVSPKSHALIKNLIH
jgi:FkbM family methyltransferase